MQLVSPMPGSVAAASTFLANAQRFTANVLTTKVATPDIPGDLANGMAQALRAASELFMAQPVSEFQDLVLARRQVIEGAQLLDRAAEAYAEELPMPLPFQNTQALAHRAYDKFEAAFEILQND